MTPSSPLSPSLRSALVLGLALLASACSTATTKVSRVWAEPTMKENRYNKVMVLVVAASDKRRVTAEDRITAQMAKEGLTPVRSHDVYPEEDVGNREKLEAAVTAAGVEGLLVVRVVNVGTETAVTEGREQWVPVATGFNDYYGYVSTAYGLYRKPDITEIRTITVETTLWDVGTKRMVWACQSDSTTANETITTAELTDAYIESMAKEVKQYARRK